MKIPKTIKISGYNFKVIVENNNTKDGGGSFSWSKKEIRINDRWDDKEITFFHEVIEAILVENLVRYYGNEGATEYKFMFNHTEFCKIVKDIYQILENNHFLRK